MAGRRTKPAEGQLEVGTPEIVPASSPTAGETPPAPQCTDERALVLAGFLAERVRMFKLPHNLIYLRKNPDGTITIESHG